MRVPSEPFKNTKGKITLLFHKSRDFVRLYTKDLTREDLEKLLLKETQQVYRFFTVDSEQEELQKLSLFKRLPRMAKSAFLGFTMKMSPARRILYALALVSFVLGVINTIGEAHYFSNALIISFAIFNLLLALELADKLMMKSDLDFARQIQLRLQPQEKIELVGVDIYGVAVPANTVGGDYYDILKISDGKVLIAIGDVSGKGAPAALLMTYLQASLRALISEELPLKELMRRLNVHLYKNTSANTLVTFFCSVLDLNARTFAYSNAGHNPPFLFRRDGTILTLSEGSIPLSISPEAKFQESAVDLQAGDLLFLYTDGITEATNRYEVEFGEQRLQAIIKNKKHLGAELLAAEVVYQVQDFVQDKKFADDLTMVVVALRDGLDKQPRPL